MRMLQLLKGSGGERLERKAQSFSICFLMVSCMLAVTFDAQLVPGL